MDDILSNALEDYKRKFGESFDPSWNPTSERDLVAKLQASNVEFTIWRSKHEKIWKTLSAIATPVIRLGRITSEVTSNACPPASAALGGLVAIIQACESVTEAYDFLEQMLTKLQDTLSRWEFDLKHDLDDQAKQHMREIMVVLLTIVARAQRLIRHNRARRYFVSLTFGKDQQTTDLMRQLEDLVQSEDRARLARSSDKIASLWERVIQIEDTRVAELLKTSAVEMNNKTYAECREERLVSTGSWFRDEKLYQYWLQRKIPLLMVLGGQGTGKTFLATALLEDLQKRQKTSQAGPSLRAMDLAYFFVKPADDLVTVLKSLAYQVQQVNPKYQSHVRDAYDQQDLYTAREIWSKLFLEYWSSDDISKAHVMLVIDGLDNIADKDIQIFAEDMIKTTVVGSDCAIQVAIFGQLKLWVPFEFIGRQNLIMVEPHKNRADIAEYISQELAKVRVLRKVEAEERLKFQQMILERCDGVFEWARLLLAKCKNQDKKRIIKTLENSPKSITNMIESCFKQILEDEEIDTQMLQTILTWLTYTRRSLNFGELYDKVCLAIGDEYTLMWYDIVAKLSSIIRWRTPRVRQWRGQEIGDDEIETLDDPEKGWSEDLRSTVLVFASPRVRDYVIDQSKALSQTGSHDDQYPPPQNTAECDIVKICLNTIRGDRLRDQKHRHLLRYPARFTIQHLQSIDMRSIDEDDRLTIAEGLIYMFYSKQAIQILTLDIEPYNDGLQTFWRLWIETDQHVKTVQSWLKWASDADLGTDTDTKNWLRLASISAKELFRPWAENIRHEWLTMHYPQRSFDDFSDSNSVVAFAIYFVPAFDHMDDQGLLPERFQTYFSLDVHGPLAEDIISAANKSELHRNSDFHLAVAVALEVVRQSTALIKHAKIAFDMDNTSWVAAWLLAEAFDRVSDNEKALHWSSIAMNLNPTERPLISSFRALWYIKCRKIDEAFKASKVGFEAGGDQAKVQSVYLYCLALRKDHAAILRFLKMLGAKQKQNKNDGSLSQLARLLSEKDVELVMVWGSIGQAYRSLQSPSDKEYVLSILEEATELLVQNHGDADQFRWSMEYSSFYCYHVVDGLEKGIGKLEGLVDRLNEEKSELDEVERSRYLVDTTYLCAFWRWQQALWYQRSSNPALSQAVDALGALATSAEALQVSKLGASKAYRATLATLFYSQWMCVNRPEQRDKWKQMFTKPVLEHLAMLDDLDPWNDVWGIVHLAGILTMAGDVDNMHALYSVVLLRIKISAEKTRARTQPPGDSDPQQEETEPDVDPLPSKAITDSRSILSLDSHGTGTSSLTREKDTTDATLSLNLDIDLHLLCQKCYCLVINLEECFVCVTCGRWFCGDCKPTTTEDSFWGRSCGSHHEFIQVWPVSEDSAYTVVVERDGELRVRKTWIEALRAQWQAVE